MGKMLVYHGSYTEVQKPEIRAGRNTKDFGVGFYCTVIKEQAERWARRFDTPVVNVYSLLINEKLDILEFKEMTDEWLDFIENRGREQGEERKLIALICNIAERFAPDYNLDDVFKAVENERVSESA